MLYQIHFGDVSYWNTRWEVMLLKEGGNVFVMSAPALGVIFYIVTCIGRSFCYININW